MSWILPLTADGQIDVAEMTRREARPLFSSFQASVGDHKITKKTAAKWIPAAFGSRFFFWLGADGESD